MQLRIDWQPPINLTGDLLSTGNATIPSAPGIYVFLRSHGRSSEALYIGKAKNLQLRVAQQLNNHKLAVAIQNAQNGKRKLVVGELKVRPGQQLDKALRTCERAFIRLYLSQGHGLLNIQGTKLKYHQVVSNRSHLRKFIPKSTQIEI